MVLPAPAITFSHPEFTAVTEISLVKLWVWCVREKLALSCKEEGEPVALRWGLYHVCGAHKACFETSLSRRSDRKKVPENLSYTNQVKHP